MPPLVEVMEKLKDPLLDGPVAGKGSAALQLLRRLWLCGTDHKGVSAAFVVPGILAF